LRLSPRLEYLGHNQPVISHNKKGTVVCVLASIVARTEYSRKMTTREEQVTLVHYFVRPDNKINVIGSVHQNKQLAIVDFF
jgi:hypothetical protein